MITKVLCVRKYFWAIALMNILVKLQHSQLEFDSEDQVFFSFIHIRDEMFKMQQCCNQIAARECYYRVA